MLRRDWCEPERQKERPLLTLEHWWTPLECWTSIVTTVRQSTLVTSVTSTLFFSVSSDKTVISRMKQATAASLLLSIMVEMVVSTEQNMVSKMVRLLRKSV